MSRVLVVSDDPSVQESIDPILIGKGHEVDHRRKAGRFCSGRSELPWRVLFYDLDAVPDVCTRIEAELMSSTHTAIVVMGVAGNNSSAKRVSSALHAGAADFLMKPLVPEEVEAVAQLLGL